MNKEEIESMRKVLGDYINSCSLAQLEAELETPSRKLLMAIPDENFACLNEELLDAPASVSFFSGQFLESVQSFVSGPLSPEDISCAANQELALAA